jgi:Protein of unknown function (DUF3298)
MRRIAIHLTTTLITFTFGITVGSLLNWTKPPAENQEVPLKQSAPSAVDETDKTEPVAVSEETHGRTEILFASGRLRIVTDEVQLKSELLRYKINVCYPQILGTDDFHIRELNRHIKRLATEQYQWPLNPSKADLRYYREKWPDVFNSDDLDYEIISANDAFLSIYFLGYGYGIGAAHGVQYSFVVNYDLTRRNQIELADIFQPRSGYLRFISDYCANEISKKSRRVTIAPRAEEFKSWNITHEGIRFNFDACSVLSCAEGEQVVDIPFSDLKRVLRPNALNLLTRQ